MVGTRMLQHCYIAARMIASAVLLRVGRLSATRHGSWRACSTPPSLHSGQICTMPTENERTLLTEQKLHRCST